jgi:CRP-like cAMP-binding protein
LADEHQAAIDCFKKMAQAGALSLQDRLCMARALSASGQHSQALSSIRNLAENGDCRVKLEYARILSAAGQEQKAVEVCNQALANASGQTARELNNLMQSLRQSQERILHKNEEEKDGTDNHQAKPETEG